MVVWPLVLKFLNMLKHLISISDLSKTEIINILDLAVEYKNGLKHKPLHDKIIASCFFEASTRTRLSFESAILRLGGKVIGFADSNNTSFAAKGESLTDTLKMINCYADAIVMRHPQDGSARLASEVCTIPIINAGDGANQHPTQTLLDLFSIHDTQKTLEGVHLGLMGDLKHSRTVHSLISAARHFAMKLYFISPKSLRLDDDALLELKLSGIQYSFHQNISDVIDKLDCLYLTRLQKERFGNVEHDNYGITLDNLKNVKPNFKIMHPLPRQSELPIEIDYTPYAYYFMQAQNGVYVRQALLDLFFGEKG